MGKGNLLATSKVIWTRVLDTGIQAYRHTGIQAYRHTDRPTDRNTQTETHTHKI